MSAEPQHPRTNMDRGGFDRRDAVDVALIGLYRVTRDPRRLEVLLRRFEPLLVSVVGGYVRADEVFEDVMQYALLGFLRALETYERSAAGVGFSTYARSEVVAEIDRRSSAAPLAARIRRARRALQRRALDVRRARPAIGDVELAAELGVSAGRLADAQQVRPARRGPTQPVSIREDERATEMDAPHPELQNVDPDDEADVAFAILGPRDVEALPLRFIDQRQMFELHGEQGGAMSIEVLRVLNRALGRIREDLEANLASAHHHDPTMPAR